MTSAEANRILLQTFYSPTTRIFKEQAQVQCHVIHKQRKMRLVLIVISLFVLLDGALGSLFSGTLYYNLSRVEDTEKLVRENKTIQVQTDVCNQMAVLIPWYQTRKNDSTCTIKIDKQKTYVNYTILVTDDFIRKFDPSCVTYDILLANQVSRSQAFGDQYDLDDIQLETRNRTQPVGPSLTDTGLTTIRVDGPLYRRAGFLGWDAKRNLDDVTKQVEKNVNENSDGRSADTTTTPQAAEQTSTSSDSVVTMVTTTRGGGGELIINIQNILVSHFNCLTETHLDYSAWNAVNFLVVAFYMVGECDEII
ncbi:hypothetical protein EG68_08198 [Paragonimus skrjabini miyazakii]|uniref:Uncharacterized protein n=1 Tax=Paragonimus skrjabini miyazakii TaxID=59628 RepID=A0A8S9YRS1_9TREM|nr:hypothetical protein EG68_08198 [Paragonimus skrjabini miyazakii]